VIKNYLVNPVNLVQYLRKTIKEDRINRMDRIFKKDLVPRSYLVNPVNPVQYLRKTIKEDRINRMYRIFKKVLVLRSYLVNPGEHVPDVLNRLPPYSRVNPVQLFKK